MMKKLLCSLLFTVLAVGFINAQEEIQVSFGTEILTDGQTAISGTDGTDFGTVTVDGSGGTSVTNQFTVTNLGDEDLIVNTPPSINDLGTGTTDWSVSGPAFIVGPGLTSTFDVTFDPTIAGPQTVEISILNTDSDESPFTFNVGGSGNVPNEPEIQVSFGAEILIDGQTTISGIDGTDFGTVTVDGLGGTSATNQFTITNTGTDDLIVNIPPAINDLGTGTSDWTVTSPSFIIGPGLTSTFDVTFDPTVAGPQTVEISITNTDSDENPFTFNVEGTGDAPLEEEIQVSFGAEILTDGQTAISGTDGTDFGTVAVDGSGGTSATNQFTITNTGTDDLIVNTPLSINDLGTGTSDWTVTAPSFIIGPGLTSTFDVTFDPTVAGSQTVEISITNTDSDESPFTFNVGGTGDVLLEEEIQVSFGVEILTDGQTTISGTDGTDFGTVTVDGSGGTSATNQFTITNTGTDDLVVNTPLSINDLGTGTSDWSVTAPSFIIGPGLTSTFDVTFDPTVAGPQTVEISITNSDSDENPFTFNIGGTGDLNEPEIDLFDNVGGVLPIGTTIDFGQQDISTGNVQFTFTIENNGTLDLTLDDPSPFVVIGGANAADFTLSIVPSSTIIPSGNTTFAITFNPSDTSIRTATVSIANNDADENPYTFNLTGEGIDANLGSPLLITQYYEGLSANDNWIEVKNVSSQPTNTGSFYLVIFKDAEATINGGIETKDPDDVTEAVLIPPLAAGGVALFSRSGALLPTTSNLGATPIATEVCSFDGNDVIVITTTNEGGVVGGTTSAYRNRIDIIGTVGTNAAVDWGSDTSLIKGCGTIEAPSTFYNANEYTILTLDEVNNASSFIGSPVLPNIALGIQTVGPTIWNGASWDNGLPDQTKQAIISGNYSGSTSFEACDLTINASGSIDLNSGNAYVLVDGNLTINGSFSIGDTESLITTDADAAISGQITKTEVSSLLNNSLDYTYWSSPVNTTFASAFSGANLDRVFEWRTADLAWFVPTSTNTMTAGRGYISQAPNGSTQHTINFVGSPNNGLVFRPVVFNDDGLDNDYTLLGNPYPSAIDIDQFILFVNNDEIRDNTDMDGTIYLWTHSTATNETNGSDPDYVGSDYATYNISGGTASANGGSAPTNNIGSGQGFFVRAKSNGSVFFQNDMRLDANGDPLANTQFFKSNAKKAVEKDRLWLDMTTDEGAFNQILVGFFDEATDAEDRAYDGTLLGGRNLRFYSKIDDTKYTIQGLGTYDQSKEVTLGFDTTLDRTFKVEISNIEGVLKTEDVYLYDNTLNTLHDLKQGAYEFEAIEGNYTNRFTLKFNSGVLNTDDIVLNNSFIVFNENSTLKIKAGVEISKLKVYDITGRLLIDSEPNSASFDMPSQQNIKTGTVLIVNATMKDGSVISKKAIKY